MWNVIVVDDDMRSVEVLKKMVACAHKPYQVTEVFSDGEAAYRYFLENRSKVDVLITDICMPGLSGLELIEKVRESDRDVACIILSSYKVFEYAQRAMELNVSRYLLKPLEPEKLAEALDTLELKEQENGKDRELNLSREVLYIKNEIENNYKNFDMDEVSARMCCSKEYLYRIFRREVGASVTGYLQDVRLSEAKRYMEEAGKYKIYEVCDMVGYEDQVYFSKLFKKKYQISPKEFQKYGQNDEEPYLNSAKMSD